MKLHPPRSPEGAATTHTGGPGTSDPTRLTIINRTLHRLLIESYDLVGYQLKDPAELDQIRYDVDAKVPEGLTELSGDITLQCASGGAATIAGNLVLFYPVQVTNRVDSNSNAVDVSLLVSAGGGYFTSSGIAGKVAGTQINFFGLNIPVTAAGVSLKITGVRVDAHQFPSGTPPLPMNVSISAPFAITPSSVTVASAQPGLYAIGNQAGISCVGSALPSTVTLSNLFAAKTAFASTRVTEGSAAAFAPRGPNDDTGTRFLLSYTGFPSGAQVYLPDFVAGSDALVPTAGGDLGLQQAAGQYIPGSGSLLLARVPYANSTGAGGQPLSLPGGGAPFNTVTSVSLTNGSGYAVYEVIDANPNAIESAQFPLFLGIPSNSGPTTAYQTLSFAPVSNVAMASTSAPVPRFAATTPASDCSIVGDCNAGYFPKLSVSGYLLNLTGFAGGLGTGGAVAIQNSGGGIMNWTATAQYVSGSNWLNLYPASGQNNGTVNVSGTAVNLAAGTYKANIIIDGGPMGGTATLPVTFTVGTPSGSSGSSSGSGGATGQGSTGSSTPATVPTVASIENAASLADAPLVPGSLTTLMGSNFAGKNVAVTFDGEAATLLYSGATQINLMVPADLASKSTTQMVVTVDGASSAAQSVQIAAAWPGIFTGGVLNQDNSVNGPAAPAAAGSVIQVFATGIPANATVTAVLGSQKNLVPLYAGRAPGIPGVQQVNVTVPAGIAGGGTAALALCVTTGAQQFCSTGFALQIQ